MDSILRRGLGGEILVGTGLPGVPRKAGLGTWGEELDEYLLVNIQKAIENGHRNSGYFPSYKMVDLSIVMLNYQRVSEIGATPSQIIQCSSTRWCPSEVNRKVGLYITPISLYGLWQIYNYSIFWGL